MWVEVVDPTSELSAKQLWNILYFFSYKIEIFPFWNNHKNLDPSSKMDLDFLGSFGMKKKSHLFWKGKPQSYSKVLKIDSEIWGHSRRVKSNFIVE